jgi:hypothetical protein
MTRFQGYCPCAHLVHSQTRGSLLLPPELNVEMTDWERSLRLREGQFAVLEAEPEPSTSGAGSSSTAVAAAPPAVAPNATSTANGGMRYLGHPGLSPVELDVIRTRLEALLPEDE